MKTTQKTEDEEYADAGEQGYSDSPALVAESGASPPASTANAWHPTARAIVLADQPTTPTDPPLPVILPVSSVQGLQINAQLVRRDGQVFYSMMFEKFLLMGS
ncbi:hypothetical protein CQW23_26210 [Capsicum baccatum]|uniref:Uncharacterized protein n=1 Tax=Capsicum baccatum TaxID=33114 RepID=A0A2G2VN54_CAPBA|nr:hypothetical protein CQW23_26210 [Capsicum baccatum]